jgi:hypothetical protein
MAQAAKKPITSRRSIVAIRDDLRRFQATAGGIIGPDRDDSRGKNDEPPAARQRTFGAEPPRRARGASPARFAARSWSPSTWPTWRRRKTGCAC